MTGTATGETGATTEVTIDGRRIGGGARCFVIAEAGVNHNGDMALAHRLVEAARAAGADAVKFQTFSAELLAAEHAPKAAYQEAATGVGSQRDMLKAIELGEDDFRSLQEHARHAGIVFLSSVFEDRSLDLLDQLGVPAFKVPSGEVTNTPFLARLASKRRPVILSTGMATLDEVRDAVEVLTDNGASQIVLLHCVSAYPADYPDINLRAMATLATEFGLPVGLSDHSLGIVVPIAAAALSASALEKHLTLDRTMAGPDHRASLEPGEFRAMVEGIRQVEAALGDGEKAPRPAERDTARVARKSLFSKEDLPAGAILTEDNILIARPGTGLSPKLLSSVVGRALLRPVRAGNAIRLEDLA